MYVYVNIYIDKCVYIYIYIYIVQIQSFDKLNDFKTL